MLCLVKSSTKEIFQIVYLFKKNFKLSVIENMRHLGTFDFLLYYYLRLLMKAIFWVILCHLFSFILLILLFFVDFCAFMAFKFHLCSKILID